MFDSLKTTPAYSCPVAWKALASLTPTIPETLCYSNYEKAFPPSHFFMPSWINRKKDEHSKTELRGAISGTDRFNNGTYKCQPMGDFFVKPI